MLRAKEKNEEGEEKDLKIKNSLKHDLIVYTIAIKIL